MDGACLLVEIRARTATLADANAYTQSTGFGEAPAEPDSAPAI